MSDISLTNWLLITSTFGGPFVAVLITLWVDHRRKTRDAQTNILRMLMATRHMPADPNYSTAINLIPVEFNSEVDVMLALGEYQRSIRYSPREGDEQRHVEEMVAKQTGLLLAMMKALGMKADPADLPISAYASQGFIARENLNIDALRAQIRTADALEASLRAEQR